MLKADCEACYCSRDQELVGFWLVAGHSNRPRVLVVQTLKTRVFLLYLTSGCYNLSLSRNKKIFLIHTCGAFPHSLNLNIFFAGADL